MLIAVAILGMGLATAAPVWQKIAERDRLEELDWIGNEFVQAVASYYEGTPGIVVKTYPSSLQSLVLDDRFVFMKRHLRRIYANPFSGQPDWELVLAPQGGIRGIRVAILVGGKLEARTYAFNPPFQR
ncbi:MAG: type II secretion system protein [Burkholderiales bacterium]|nr:type II secretion system protein [Burkholderiales bacterium]